MKKWRVIENEWNLRQAPSRGAVGIEEIDDEAAIPAAVCWFPRPNAQKQAEHVVGLHNAFVDLFNDTAVGELMQPDAAHDYQIAIFEEIRQDYFAVEIRVHPKPVVAVFEDRIGDED